jgi:hypothetical protein
MVEMVESNGVVVSVTRNARAARFSLSKNTREQFIASCAKHGVDPNDITVCLSRDGKKCATPVNSMELHDDHAPKFYEDYYLNAYVTRVVYDVAGAINTLQPMESIDVTECSHCGGEHPSDDCNWCEYCCEHGYHITEDCDVYCDICENYGHLEDGCEEYWCDNCDNNTHDTDDCDETDEESFELSDEEEEDADEADSEFMEIVSDTRP